MTIYVLEIEWQDARFFFTFSREDDAKRFACEEENKGHKTFGEVIDWQVYQTRLTE